jgi:transposase InsO family protein
MGAVVIMRDQVYHKEGLPAKVYSDQRPQFVSRFMKHLYTLLGIEENLSTAYHPQTDGQTERINYEVKKYLRMFTNHRQDNWVDWLPLAEFMYNNIVNEVMGYTPFFLNKG